VLAYGSPVEGIHSSNACDDSLPRLLGMRNHTPHHPIPRHRTMASQEPNSKQSNLELSYIRLSPSPHPDGSVSSDEPIVFLHGLETCHIEFSRTTPFLSQDHEVILVDLPGHSDSKDILPLTLENAANALFRLISTEVTGGKVHMVGMSLGGFVGLEFARRYPELVLSLFCTGCAPYSGLRRWVMSQSRLLAGVGIVGGRLATDAMFWYPIGVEPLPALREEFRKNQSMALLMAGYTAVHAVRLEDLAKIDGVRIAIVAGGKRDSVRDTKEAGKVLGSKNPGCKAFVVRDAVHLWDLQLPELFAQGVTAWVGENEMPKEFEAL
jgi:pimeloyl-ACP methyl ester carboxylesterase